jgi:hypothetical protein
MALVNQDVHDFYEVAINMHITDIGLNAFTFRVLI